MEQQPNLENFEKFPSEIEIRNAMENLISGEEFSEIRKL